MICKSVSVFLQGRGALCPCLPQTRRFCMALEDKWLIGIIAFIILFTASFGVGLWG